MVQYSFSLENFEIFILILVRVSCFVYIAPFYGMSNVPNQVKIGLSAMIALLVSGFADVSQVEYTGRTANGGAACKSCSLSVSSRP